MLTAASIAVTGILWLLLFVAIAHYRNEAWVVRSLRNDHRKQLMRAAVLYSKAGQAEWLAQQLERVWHAYNNEKDTLPNPLSEKAVPESIQEHRHKLLWEFRVHFRGHVGGVKSNEPDFHSEIVDAPTFWKADYLDVKRKLGMHAEALRTLARSLESTERT
jgi:hypothetical protein